MGIRRKQPGVIRQMVSFWNVLNPPLVERELVRTMGQWFMRSRGFAPHVMIGAVYQADFASLRKSQVLYITGRRKPVDDILKSQRQAEFERLREDYLHRHNYDVLYIDAMDVFKDPDGVRTMVREWSKSPAKYYEKYYGEDA